MGKYLRYVTVGYSGELNTRLGKLPLNAVHEHFQRALPKIEGRGIVKVHIELTADDIPSEEDLIDVLVVRRALPDSFPTEGSAGKRALLDFIVTVLVELSDRRGWDSEAFRAAARVLEENELHFGGRWGRRVASPDRHHYAEIVYEHDLTLSAQLRVLDRQKRELARRLFAIVPATLGALKAAAAKLKWDDNANIRILWENGRDYWTYNIARDDLQFVFPRAEQGDARGQYDLGMMYLRGGCVLQDREQAEVWLSRAAAQGYARAVRALEALEAPR